MIGIGLVLPLHPASRYTIVYHCIQLYALHSVAQKARGCAFGATTRGRGRGCAPIVLYVLLHLETRAQTFGNFKGV